MDTRTGQKRCACKSHDAQRCLEMRLPYLEAQEAMAEGERCECLCHNEYREKNPEP